MKKTLGILAILLTTVACDAPKNQIKSDSGVGKAKATVGTGSDGLTAEQRNIKERVEEDNKPGAIKHLYVISAYSGQVILYSTVVGKVTSSGKRLTPSNVTTSRSSSGGTIYYGFPLNIGGRDVWTEEVLGDDGAYGSGSAPYLYWKDTKGNYHQHYVQGGQILHVSDVPLAVKSIIINMELTPVE